MGLLFRLLGWGRHFESNGRQVTALLRSTFAMGTQISSSLDTQWESG